jgi:hypothetical protein
MVRFVFELLRMSCLMVEHALPKVRYMEEQSMSQNLHLSAVQPPQPPFHRIV